MKLSGVAGGVKGEGSSVSKRLFTLVGGVPIAVEIGALGEGVGFSGLFNVARSDSVAAVVEVIAVARLSSAKMGWSSWGFPT